MGRERVGPKPVSAETETGFRVDTQEDLSQAQILHSYASCRAMALNSMRSVALVEERASLLTQATSRLLRNLATVVLVGGFDQPNVDARARHERKASRA